MCRAGQDKTHVGEASPVRVDIDAIGSAIGFLCAAFPGVPVAPPSGVPRPSRSCVGRVALPRGSPLRWDAWARPYVGSQTGSIPQRRLTAISLLISLPQNT